MTAPLPPDPDELVSAYLDDQVAPGERSLVEGDPSLSARADELRAVAGAVGEAPPPDPARREAHIGAALAEFDSLFADPQPAALPQESPTPEAMSAPVSLDRARERRERRRLPMVAAAAALIAVVFAGIVATNFNRGDSADVVSEATFAADTADTADDTAQGDADEATEDAASASAPAAALSEPAVDEEALHDLDMADEAAEDMADEAAEDMADEAAEDMADEAAEETEAAAAEGTDSESRSSAADSAEPAADSSDEDDAESDLAAGSTALASPETGAIVDDLGVFDDIDTLLAEAQHWRTATQPSGIAELEPAVRLAESICWATALSELPLVDFVATATVVDGPTLRLVELFVDSADGLVAVDVETCAVFVDAP